MHRLTLEYKVLCYGSWAAGKGSPAVRTPSAHISPADTWSPRPALPGGVIKNLYGLTTSNSTSVRSLSQISCYTFYGVLNLKIKNIIASLLPLLARRRLLLGA